MLEVNQPFFVEALVDAKEETDAPKLIAQKIYPLNLVQQNFTKEIHIRMHEGSARKEMLLDIRNLCRMHAGPSTLIFCLTCSNGEISFAEASAQFNVRVTPELTRGLTDIIGENTLHFKADLTVPEPKAKPWEKKGGWKNGN
jgi:hypothetical protein